MSSSYLRRAAVAVIVAVLGLVLPASALAGAGPAVVGAIANNTSLSGAVDVTVAGNYAYSASYYTGQLTVIDLANPASPQVVGTTAATASLKNASEVTVSGQYAFVVSKNRNASTSSNDDGTGNSLTIVDISNPNAPTVVGSVHSGTALFGGYGIAVQGNYAYVAYQGVLGGQPQSPDTSTGGFSVIDITNPAGPTIVGNIDNGPTPATNADLNHATSVAVSGHYAYVTAWSGFHFTVIDISRPTSPTIAASIGDATNLHDPNYVTISGNYAYVADQNGSSYPQLTIVSVLNPTHPAIVGTLNNATALAGAYRVRVRGNFAYIAAHSASTVAAIDVSNPASPRLAGYVTDAAHLNGTSDLGLDSTGRYVIASSPQLSTEGSLNPTPYPPFTNTTGTISVIDMIPNPIAVPISSAPPTTTTSTSASFAFAANDDVSTVACSLDGAAYSACSSQTSEAYSGLSVGSHTFKVQATDAAGNQATSTYTWTVGTAPQPGTPGPSISGTASVGQPLTASAGTWSGSPAPSFTYQWVRCDQNGQSCVPFGAATTSNSYTPQPSDAGSSFAVTVTGTNSLGSSQATSSATQAVTEAPVAGNPGPAISGTLMVGQTLTTTSGTWSGYPAPAFDYQWQRCTGSSCVPVGSDSASYTLQPADSGSSVEVTVTASNSAGSSQATSGATGVIQGAGTAPTNVTRPTISPSSPTVGQGLTASPGTWSGNPNAFSYSYQWQRCSGTSCLAVGSNSASYTPQPADAGSTIQVVVTASNGVAPAGQAASAATSPVREAPTGGVPTISGAMSQNQTLTASPGTWTGYPSAFTYAYQWQRCDQNGQNCGAISGATGGTYTLQRADVGQTVRVLVTAANTSGSSAQTPSAVTARVAGPPVNTSLPTVSGTDVQGSTLTATPGTWTGYPVPGFTYEWQRCPTNGEGCTMISTARSARYTLTAADVGYSMRIYVQAQNSAGYQPARSAGTAVVQSNTSASIAGLFTTHAKLVLRSQTPGSTIRTVRVSLGGGLGFTASLRALTHAVSVTDASGRHISFSLKLSHGTLVLSLKHPVSKVRVTVAAPGLTVAGHISRSPQKHGSHLTMTVVLGETGNRSARDRIQLPLH